MNPENEVYVFNLYVSGMTPKSIKAIETIKSMCEKYLKDRYQLEVFDIYQHPEILRKDQKLALAVPALIKRLPLPTMTLIGNLYSEEDFILKFGLQNKI
ncbi:MAG: circadian clock KaiB family protein [Desulfobacterales bacterium]|nr:circadian clock KaiB family protein [Desulfobacterales bacterium]